ncbi:unnamed protein product [Didymodactylos carnosus]|uniref:Uncharacterized protein n=1 Tax=Didymodactylos carnosus TaxID=1234261 RepID=A0A815FAQ4_9BILA|nr:unnamed protein product [Didymodactylos carnosus]CAF1322526.1 unnamed protein product [Didymodactylos carnosus]CAF3852890.1 unnamed protein product [Didymodactylos carnosus]CAF4169650.1 unnamed protein product [Didymodactylos carnosus]
MIIYWLSYSFGRLICAFASVFIEPHISLSVAWITGLGIATLWIIYVWIIRLSITSLFVLGAFTGLVFSPIFPLSFGFINTRLNVIPALLAVFLSGTAFGSILFQKLAGKLLDSNPKHFPTLLITCVLLAIMFYAATTVVNILYKKNTKTNKKFSPSSENREHSVRDTNKLAAAEEEQNMANFCAEQDDKDNTSL